MGPPSLPSLSLLPSLSPPLTFSLPPLSVSHAHSVFLSLCFDTTFQLVCAPNLPGPYKPTTCRPGHVHWKRAPPTVPAKCACRGKGRQKASRIKVFAQR